MTVAPTNIPSLSSKVDPEVKRAITALADFLNRLQSSGGVVTKDDVVSSGLFDKDMNLTVPTSPGSTAEEDLSVPQAASALVATGGFNKVILSWTLSPSSNVVGYDVYRATVDDSAQAVNIGWAPGALYGDSPSDTSLSKTYYYWVKPVSKASISGPFNQAAGTPGSTADDPGYVLETFLDSKWKPNTAYALGALCYPTAPNGYAYRVTVAGTSGATEPNWYATLTAHNADGTIDWVCTAEVPLAPPFILGLVGGVVKTIIKDLMIGDATITNAMIQSVAADKISATTLSAIVADMGTITAGKMQSTDGKFVIDLTNKTITIEV